MPVPRRCFLFFSTEGVISPVKPQVLTQKLTEGETSQARSAIPSQLQTIYTS